MPKSQPSPASEHKIREHLTLQLPAAQSGCIWVHACSVGEVGSVVPLIRRLLQAGHAVHLTVVTRTGFAHAKRLLGESVALSYLPWDLPGLMARFVERLSPRLLLLVETEFWPGMLRACQRREIPIVGINTRISDRSFPRYYASRWLWRRWLAPVARFLAQSEADAERLARIGVPTARIEATGNLKYAVSAPSVDAEALRHKIDPTGSRAILLIASTHEDEEQRLLRMLPAWRADCPGLLPVIVPRHPERFDAVAGLIRAQAFHLSRWSAGEAAADILLIDAMGVLAGLYAIADAVIIGGSLADIGGHNPLEAAVCGRGVVTGPHVQNFRAVMQQMQHAGAAIIAGDDRELEQAIGRLLQHPDELRRLNAHAAAFMQAQGDILEHIWQQLTPWLNRNG